MRVDWELEANCGCVNNLAIPFYHSVYVGARVRRWLAILSFLAAVRSNAAQASIQLLRQRKVGSDGGDGHVLLLRRKQRGLESIPDDEGVLHVAELVRELWAYSTQARWELQDEGCRAVIQRNTTSKSWLARLVCPLDGSDNRRTS